MNALCAILARRDPFNTVAALLAVSMIATVHISAQSTNRQIGLGEARSFRSAILNEDREVQIALPDSYGRSSISYPVLFLLDGSSHLLHGSATVRFLASARNRIPEMIVVAIPNTNRNRDMTPGTWCRHLSEGSRRGAHPMGGAQFPGGAGADSLRPLAERELFGAHPTQPS